MIKTFRRRGDHPRPRVEALEARALMAVGGSLDPAFAAGHGSATAPLGIPVNTATVSITPPPPITSYSGYSVQADAVDVLPDGNIVVSGPISSTVANQTSYAYSVAELNADGTPDASFGSGGKVSFPAAANQVFRMAVQSSGQIVLASGALDASGTSTYLAIRLNPDGSLDPTFGSGGVAEYPASSANLAMAIDRISQVAAVLPEPNGQILLAGNAYLAAGGFAVVRLDSDGSLDTSYGVGGTANVPTTDAVTNTFVTVANSATMEPGGQVVLVGDEGMYDVNNRTGNTRTNCAAVVTRLNADGSLDTTFGGPTAKGIVTLPLSTQSTVTGDFNFADAVAIQPTTGDILVAGSEDLGPLLGSPPTLYGLTSAGVLDTNFGTDGMVHPSIYISSASDLTMAVLADGNIVLSSGVASGPPTGPAGTPEADQLELAELNPNGFRNGDFGPTSYSGVDVTTLPASSTGLTPAIDPTTGDILVAGVGTIGSPTGLTYGFAVDSILTASNEVPAVVPAPLPPADFSGQGYSDLSFYDPTTGSYVNRSIIAAGPAQAVQVGVAGVGQTIPAAADYSGVGYDQDAVYLTASGTYAVPPTINSPGLFLPFGIPGAGQTIPVPADYYGTGQATVAVYLPSQATFAIMGRSYPGYGMIQPGPEIAFGIAGAGQSIPVPADYYGSGQADLAVYLAASGVWAIQPVLGVPEGEVIPFGKAGLGESVPVPGDYDGSGKVELAVYVPSVGAFYYRSAKGNGDVMVPIGVPNSGAIAAPGDYDGSGRMEVAIYSPSNGSIEYLPANGGPDVIETINPPAGSIPVATPTGDLPEFAAAGNKPGSGAKAKAIVPASAPSGSTASTSAITLSGQSAVPSGPTLASIRVARSPINQAAPDPHESS